MTFLLVALASLLALGVSGAVRICALILLALLTLGACAGPPKFQRVPVPMRCDAEVRDPIDCKLLEFNCRNSGGRWTGTACQR